MLISIWHPKAQVWTTHNYPSYVYLALEEQGRILRCNDRAYDKSPPTRDEGIDAVNLLSARLRPEIDLRGE